MRFSCTLAAFAPLFFLGIAAHAQDAGSGKAATIASKAASLRQLEPQTAQLNSQATNSRLKIGLALEGGGALGQAHIGVLKYFEEHHIPIDYIAGTSMGGLVGGFYATGSSAEQLKNVVEHADWDLLLFAKTPYEDLAFRRKEDVREVPNSLQVGLRHGAALPSGLNTGHQINLLIDQQTLPYSNVQNFDDLPIPFRCVSTELVSGNKYVFKSGSLSEALRATLSIPGVFAPVRRGEQIFVDGGMVDNLPTDVVRQMGADVVIGVHLEREKPAAKEIQSAFEVLTRSVEVVIAQTEVQGIAGADLLIRTDVTKFTPSEFAKSSEMIASGYQSAQQMAGQLKPYELNDADWAAYQERKRARKLSDVGTATFVRVEGADPEGTINIERLLKPLTNHPLKTAEIDQILTLLTGMGRYDSVTYSFVRDGDRVGLLIRVHEKTFAPPLLQPSFQVDGSEPEDVTFTLGARVTALDVAGYGSEWRSDLKFGETYGLATELYRPFRPLGKLFFAPFVDASETTFKVYDRSNPRADYRLENVQGGMDFGYSFSRFSELRVGYGIGYFDETLRLGQPEFASVSGRLSGLRMRYVFDHTNEPVIPTGGYYVESHFRFMDTAPGASEAFPSLDLKLKYFQPVSKSGSIFLTAQGGSTFGSQHTGVPQFFLGGPGNLSAYGLNELFGNQYFFGRAGYLQKVFTLPQFVGKRVYVAGYADLGKMYGGQFDRVPRFSADGAAGVVAETVFGPVFLGGSIGDTGHRKWFFQLGRIF